MRAIRRHSHAADGFTVVEVLVVVAILAVVAAITIPAITRPSDRFVLRETMSNITSALRLTRSAAIRSNIEQVFVVDVNERRYGSAAVRRRSYSREVSLAFTVAEPERASPSRGGIRFFPDGSSTGGELTLAINGQQAKICVHWLTGRPIQASAC